MNRQFCYESIKLSKIGTVCSKKFSFSYFIQIKLFLKLRKAMFKIIFIQ